MNLRTLQLRFANVRRWLLPAMLGVATVAAGCGQAGEPHGHAHAHPRDGEPMVARVFEGEYPINIVATTGYVADLARNIGGEHVRVTALMGEGVDPHLYMATPGDLRRMRQADLIFYNGLHLEGRMADVLVRLARREPTYAVTEGLDPARLREPPEFEGMYDPHVWFDAALWQECAAFVRDVLAAFDPPHADAYRANAAQYLAELAELDAWARDRFAEIPERRRVLVTAHDAFGYMGAAYGIEVLPIQGISTETEAGVFRINELVATLVERGIGAVFIETSLSDKNVRALIEGARARGHTVRIGGELFSDAPGAHGTPEGTYIGAFRHNVETIVEALK